MSDALRDAAIAGFVNSYAQSASDLEKSMIRYDIQRLMEQGRFTTLDAFLNDIAERGADRALASHRTLSRGSKLSHGWLISTALLEIAIVLLAISKCEHGFQSIVIAALGLIYSILHYRQLAAAKVEITTFAALNEWMISVRRLLKDKSLQAENAEEELESIRKGLAKSEVPHRIVTVKLALVFFICLVVLVMNSL